MHSLRDTAFFFFREIGAFFLPLHLNPRGGHQMGIPEYQVLRGLVESIYLLIHLNPVGVSNGYSKC